MDNESKATTDEKSQGHVEVHRQRFFSAHHMMMYIARRALMTSRALPEQFAENMVAIVMCASAVEALANALGERLFKEWHDFDKLTPLAKLRLCFSQMKVTINRGHEPWQSITWLASLRNEIVHSKAANVSESQKFNLEEWSETKQILLRYTNWPRSKLENKLNLENAEKAVQTVDSLMEKVTEYLHEDLRPGITTQELDMRTTHITAPLP